MKFLYTIRFLLFLCLLISPLRAEFSTPGNGGRYSLGWLSVFSGGAVTGNSGAFQIHQTVVISATDTLDIFPGDTLVFTDQTGLVELNINGALLALGTASDSIIITSASQSPGDYYGLRFRDTAPGSAFRIRYARIEYATRAIRVFGAAAEVEHCLIRHSSEVAVKLSQSNSVVRDCVIEQNRRETIVLSLGASPVIENNLIRNNNIDNASPYPYINIGGLQGNSSPVVRGNTIIGGYEMSGAISIWGSSNALIEGNTIRDCAYGILCFQSGANPRIKNNVLLNNAINPNPEWGFGIACNGSNAPVVTGNEIRGHFYGVAIVNGGQPNLGDLNNADSTDDGGNWFLGNGRDGRQYELFNNNPLPIMAENNWWGTNNPDSIAARIVDQNDSTFYGPVDFTPFIQQDPTGVNVTGTNLPLTLELLPNYPNPFNPLTNIEFRMAEPGFARLAIYDLLGKRVKTLVQENLAPGVHTVQWDSRDNLGRPVASGVYLYRLDMGEFSQTRKMVLMK